MNVQERQLHWEDDEDDEGAAGDDSGMDKDGAGDPDPDPAAPDRARDPAADLDQQEAK